MFILKHWCGAVYCASGIILRFEITDGDQKSNRHPRLPAIRAQAQSRYCMDDVDPQVPVVWGRSAFRPRLYPSAESAITLSTRVVRFRPKGRFTKFIPWSRVDPGGLIMPRRPLWYIGILLHTRGALSYAVGYSFSHQGAIVFFSAVIAR